MKGDMSKPFIPGRTLDISGSESILPLRRLAVPQFAVAAFNLVWIVLILIFIRFRFSGRFAKIVYLAFDALICIFLLALIFICLRFSTL
jgi:hypothetical protein